MIIQLKNNHSYYILKKYEVLQLGWNVIDAVIIVCRVLTNKLTIYVLCTVYYYVFIIIMLLFNHEHVNTVFVIICH